MNIPDVATLMQYVSACWEAADQATMAGVPPGIVMQQNGQMVGINSFRANTYVTLLQSVLPKGDMAIRHDTPKEPWQE